MTIGQHRYAIHLTLIVVMAMFATIGATHANEERFADTYIAKLAAGLKPGEFVPFEAGVPPGVSGLPQLLRGIRPDGSGAPAIDTWTDSAYWDTQRKRVFFQGLRKGNRFLTYDAYANVWNEISLDVPNAPPLFERFGHLYGRTALDWKRGHFYRLSGSTLHRYVIDDDRWERFDKSPVGGNIPIDWHYGLDMLVAVEKNELHGFRDGRWTLLGASKVHGYHSSAKYNPKRRDMLFIGGNHSRNNVDILTAEGQVMHMRDAPFGFGISQDNLTHDPISGNYLVLHRDRILWEYSPDLDEWRIARDMREAGERWPFTRYGGIVPIAVDELDAILWNHGQAAQAYRHRSVFTAQEQARTARVTSPTQQRPPLVMPAPDPAVPKPPKPKENKKETTSTLPVPTLHNPESIIEREAQTMQPGEWRNIADLTTWPGKDEGVSFKTFQYVRGIEDGKGGADGMGWTQNLVYHKGKLMMLLMRDSFERALMVMEPDGRFWRINQPEGFDQRGHRRPFNKLTQDDTYMYYSPNIGRSNLGRMIRTPLDNPGVFESYGIPIGDSQIAGQFAATYVPEWDRFYAYTPGGKIWSWAEGETDWTRHADMPRDENDHRLSGYAGLLLWNPVRKELVIVGGQTFGRNPSTSHKVYRLTTPLGAPEMLEDRRLPNGQPMPWGSGSSKLLIDPRDGSYIILRGRVLLYRNQCAGGTFSLYEDLGDSRPFGRYEPYAPLALVPGTDVVVFLSHIRGLVLHRLKALTDTANTTQCESIVPSGDVAALAPSPRTETPSKPAPSTEPPQPPTEDSPIQHNAPPTPQPPPASKLPQAPAEARDDLASNASALTAPMIRSARSDGIAAPRNLTVTAAQVDPAPNARTLTPSDIRALRAQAPN